MVKDTYRSYRPKIPDQNFLNFFITGKQLVSLSLSLSLSLAGARYFAGTSQKTTSILTVLLMRVLLIQSIFYHSNPVHILSNALEEVAELIGQNFKKFSSSKLVEYPILGVANGTSKNVGLGKFWQDLEISEAFLISLEVSFLHGLYLLFLSLETFY